MIDVIPHCNHTVSIDTSDNVVRLNHILNVTSYTRNEVQYIVYAKIYSVKPFNDFMHDLSDFNQSFTKKKRDVIVSDSCVVSAFALILHCYWKTMC